MLTIEDLHTYYGASHILQGVNLSLETGAVAAVLGRNGVGKTTTMKTIMGLAKARRGKIAIDGVEITRLPPHMVARSGVAYVPEGRLIFPDLDVVENIKVAERKPPKTWTIERLFELFPSLQERRTNKGSQLSGGEQQMLAIARALVSDPRVILLDEPSQGLAPKVVREVADVIQRLRREGVTVLLVEQNLKLAERVADRMFIMVKGRIVYDAPPAQFHAEIDEIRSRYLTL
jgi:branched-chain amino acid transport system ATP-binding protein